MPLLFSLSHQPGGQGRSSVPMGRTLRLSPSAELMQEKQLLCPRGLAAGEAKCGSWWEAPPRQRSAESQPDPSLLQERPAQLHFPAGRRRSGWSSKVRAGPGWWDRGRGCPPVPGLRLGRLHLLSDLTQRSTSQMRTLRPCDLPGVRGPHQILRPVCSPCFRRTGRAAPPGRTAMWKVGGWGADRPQR